MTRRSKQIRIHRGRSAPLRPPTPRPLDAAIMMIDSAKTSGIALYVRGRLYAYNECNARDPRARLHVLRELITTATVRGLPYAVALEVPWGGYQSVALSLHATATLWRDSWLQLEQRDELMVDSGDAARWRKRLFGDAKMPRDYARRIEMSYAHQVVRRDILDPHVRRVGPDAAAAICIGQVMIRSPELQQTLGCGLVPP